MTGKLSKSQIGRSGEILVQYRMLKHGIESAPMTTDSGIDLVAYAPYSKRAVTIQVKANLKPKPAGGKGRAALDWWLIENSPAELVALVDLSTDRTWLFRHAELAKMAQQHSGGQMHFFFYVDPQYAPKCLGTHVTEFADFEIDNRIGELFGMST